MNDPSIDFSPEELDALVQEALDVTDDAGALLLDGLHHPKDIEYKGEVDLVTQYDKAAEHLIMGRLSTAFPQIDMLAEESNGTERPTGTTRWIIESPGRHH